VIVICAPLLVAGAVNVPSLEIEPAEATQVTAELPEPCTVAVNRCWAVGLNVAVGGSTDTAEFAEDAGADA